MKTRLRQLWEGLRASYWFIPGLMTMGAVALAFSAEAVDRFIPPEVIRTLTVAYQGGPDGARALLTTVAGSMITVAGVAFSITVVALVLASQQFGPRILRNFMRDRGNQFVLGTFIATFLYCLLVLRTVQSLDERTFVPHVSITFAVLLALASVAVLIYFIDHIATSIQAPNVVARVGADLDRAVDKIFREPEEVEEEEAKEKAADEKAAKEDEAEGNEAEGNEAEGNEAEGSVEEPKDEDASGLAGTTRGRRTRREIRMGWFQSDEIREDGIAVTGDESGYIQFIDESGLVEAAARADVVISCMQRQGGFAVEGGPIARVGPPENVDDDLKESIRSAFLYGRTRTDIQDVDFAVKQLVEIAVRALSPGINDPFTAMNCIDQLTASLARAGRRVPTDPRLRDDEGTTRVILPRPVFPDLLDAAFDPIREHGRSTTDVLARLLGGIISLENIIERHEGRVALRRHADRVSETAERALTDEAGRRRIEALYRLVERRLEDVVEEEDEDEGDDEEEADGEAGSS